MTDTAAAIAAVSAGERKINICAINEMITCKVRVVISLLLHITIL